jgi:hypothetical protein
LDRRYHRATGFTGGVQPYSAKIPDICHAKVRVRFREAGNFRSTESLSRM